MKMVMAKEYCVQLVCLLICSLAIINTTVSCAKENVTLEDIDEAYYVSKTIVENAVSKGAVCLDGSPPAYHFEPGFGEGAQSWIVQLSGGEWCRTIEACVNRSKSDLGSSRVMKPWLFKGIFSKNQTANSDFYNWNKVYVRYCDGGGFTGDVEYVDPATNLHFRGARIFEAVMEDLLAKGLKEAKNSMFTKVAKLSSAKGGQVRTLRRNIMWSIEALLSGSSAGGYPAMLYCDRFHELLPKTPRVKCMNDAGYFIYAGPPYKSNFTELYTALVTLHSLYLTSEVVGSAKALPKPCTSKMSPELCFFPENMQQYIKTPLFITMSPYDKYQINQTIGIGINTCIEYRNCSASENKTFRDFRSIFLNALPKANCPKLKGVFVDAFNHHSQVQEWWNPINVTTIKNLTLSKAFGDWYFDRNYTYVIDEQDLPISALLHAAERKAKSHIH